MRCKIGYQTDVLVKRSTKGGVSRHFGGAQTSLIAALKRLFGIGAKTFWFKILKLERKADNLGVRFGVIF